MPLLIAWSQLNHLSSTYGQLLPKSSSSLHSYCLLSLQHPEWIPGHSPLFKAMSWPIHQREHQLLSLGSQPSWTRSLTDTSHQWHPSFPCFSTVGSGCWLLLFPMPQQPWLTSPRFCRLLISMTLPVSVTPAMWPFISDFLLIPITPQNLCFSTHLNISPAPSENSSVLLNGDSRSPRTVTWTLRYRS